MKRVEKSVFLSYRRTNLPWALAIFQNLRQHGYDVFLDYNGIASGDFEQVILENIRASAHFIVVLTPSALERCDDPADWLRSEIETALANQRNIVPLMLEGFTFGTPKIASQLTGKLAALRHYNGLIIPPEYFEEAMERLRNRYLSVPLAAVLHPASVAAQKAASLQRAAAHAAPAVQEKELTAQQWFERGFAASDTDEKLRCYSEAIRLKPDNALAFIDRGNARDDKGDLDEAIKDFSEAIRLEPKSSDALFFRGQARINKADFDGAITDFSEAIRAKTDYTDHAWAFWGRGQARLLKGDLDEAINDFNEGIRLEPKSSGAFFFRSRRAKADYANHAWAFWGRGQARLLKDDVDEAIKDFNEAIRRNPNHADAFIGRGYARDGKDNFDGAIKDFSEAIRLQPDRADGFIGRGYARHGKRDFDGAIKDFSEAIRRKPDRGDAFVGRGEARHRKGDLDEAIKDFNEAIRLEPDNSDAFNNRGIARRAKGDLEGAAEDSKEAMRLKSAARA